MMFVWSKLDIVINVAILLDHSLSGPLDGESRLWGILFLSVSFGTSKLRASPKICTKPSSKPGIYGRQKDKRETHLKLLMSQGPWPVYTLHSTSQSLMLACFFKSRAFMIILGKRWSKKWVFSMLSETISLTSRTALIVIVINKPHSSLGLCFWELELM